MRKKWDSLCASVYAFTRKRTQVIMVLVIFLVVPLVTGLLLGYEMSENRIGNIPTVVMDHDNSEFSRTVVEYVAENDIFDVIVSADSDRQVEDMIHQGTAYVGLILPEGLSADMKAGDAPKVLVIYDGSVMTVASSAKSAMSEILLTLKAGYMENIFEGKQNVVPSQAEKMIQPMDVAYRTLYNPAKNYRNFFLPGMLAALIQVGIAVVGLERAKEEETTYLMDIGKIIFWGILGALGIFICLGVQHLFFGLPFRGSLTAFLFLTLLFSMCQTAFGYIVGKAVPDKVFASQVCCVLILPASILGGYTFPIMAMPAFFQKLSMFIPLSHYGDAVRNLSLKDAGMGYYTDDAMYLLIFLAVELVILLAVQMVRRLVVKRIAKDGANGDAIAKDGAHGDAFAKNSAHGDAIANIGSEIETIAKDGANGDAIAKNSAHGDAIANIGSEIETIVKGGGELETNA